MESTKKYNHEYVKFDERHVVYLKEFIIYEQEDKDKFAIFKFFNNYIEELNNVEFLIKQYDIEGALIAENTLKYSNFKADKKTEFSPYTKLMVEDECHRVEAVLVKATFTKHYFEDNKLSTLKDVENMKHGLKPSRRERNKVRTKKIKNKNKIKYFVLAPFLAVALVVSAFLTWDSVENFAKNLTQVSDENFHYTIINGKATVDKYYNSDEDVTIVSDIYGYEVTKIKKGLFQNTNVETVTIRSDEIEIGEDAFRNCTALEKVSCNKVTSVGDYAFYGCENLSAFNFKKTEEIGDYSFANTNIKKVESDTLTRIGNNAFANCNEITEIDVINAEIGNNAFSKELVIEEISIGDFTGSIGNIFGIQNEELVEHFKVINCKPWSIKSGDFDGIDFKSPVVNLDYSFATIEYKSMQDYFKKADISFIDTGRSEIIDGVLISIDSYFGNTLDEQILQGKTITSISPGVIAGFSGDDLTIDISNVVIDENTLIRSNFKSLKFGHGVIVEDDAIGENETLTSLTVYGFEGNNYSEILKDAINVTKITVEGPFVPAGYFEGLTQLTTINFKDDVEIGSNAFGGCKNLVNIDFTKVYKIGEGAFKGCEGIKKIEFSSNIQSIGKNAFKDCKYLEDINSLPEEVVIDNAFTGENNITSLEIFNYGISINEIGNFDKLKDLTIKYNYKSNVLCSNLVSSLPNLKTLVLPDVSSYQSNIVNNCKNLKFISLYTNPSTIEFIGKGCTSLYYVTINGNINTSYGMFNKSASYTKNLYINGEVSNFDLIGTDNLNYVSISEIQSSYLGELFGAPTATEQSKFVPVSLKTVEIGNSTIDAKFFYGCSYLHNILLPNATNIYSDALTGLSSIRNIYFGSNSISSTSFATGFNDDEHTYKPTILGNSLVLQRLRAVLNDVNYVTSNGIKTYEVYNNGEEVGIYNSVLIHSIDEILDRYDLAGSLSFERNSNTPANVEYYSSSNRLYQFTPEEVKYEAHYVSPVAITYHYKDANGMETVETVIYDKDTNGNASFFIPECKDLFAGWYTDEELTDLFDFQKEQTLKTNIDLYAKQVRKTSNLYTESLIADISGKAYIYSTVNKTVEVFVYGNDAKYQINGKKYDTNQKITLNVDAYILYEIDVNEYCSISVIFGNENDIPSSKVKVQINEKSFKDFKLNGSIISNYDMPNVEGYELVGWYDSKGDLVIDKYGNVYKYSETEVYARWEYIAE